MAKSSKLLGQCISNDFFGILLYLALEFQDLFILLLSWNARNSQCGNFAYKPWIDIIEGFEDFNTQSGLVANISTSVF